MREILPTANLGQLYNRLGRERTKLNNFHFSLWKSIADRLYDRAPTTSAVIGNAIELHGRWRAPKVTDGKGQTRILPYVKRPDGNIENIHLFEGGLQPLQTVLNIWIDTHGVYVATYIAQYVLFT